MQTSPFVLNFTVETADVDNGVQNNSTMCPYGLAITRGLNALDVPLMPAVTPTGDIYLWHIDGPTQSDIDAGVITDHPEPYFYGTSACAAGFVEAFDSIMPEFETVYEFTPYDDENDTVHTIPHECSVDFEPYDPEVHG